MVPIMFVRLDRLPAEVKVKYDVSSLKATPHIAAPMPIDVKHRMIDWWGPVLSDAYGASEIGVVTRISSEEWLEKPGSVGKPIDSFTLQIVDDDGKELPCGETGMIYMTSLTAVDLEYLDDPEKTAAAHLSEKQFTLGDMGWLDEDGNLYLADRRVDMINSGGVNIYPAEIEMALLAHPAVEDVAVFGIPSTEWGQDVRAAIQLRPGFAASEDLSAEILPWLRENIAHYKVPKSIDYHGQLPRYSNGKLHRRVLRDVYW
jgi:long-chain acyl-CoA synthetase